MVSGDALTEPETSQEDSSRIDFLRLSEPPEGLSPVPENLSESSDLSLVEGQFSDALEDLTAQDNVSVKVETSPKRDSKIEDHFHETESLAPIREKTRDLEDTKEVQKVPEQEGEGRQDIEQQNQDHDREEDIQAKTQPTSPVALSLLLLGVCSAVLLMSLDRTIITTAIPAITNEFHSTDAVGWYGSAYLVTACAFQPTYGKIFTLFDTKWTFLHSVAVFQIGSLICAVSPSSTVLIVGRSIAGWGSAGMLTGAFVVIAKAVPLEKRPLYTAAVGVMYGIGAATGPLIGGMFTGWVTWRWCFYVNLPIGTITIIVTLLCFKSSKEPICDLPFIQRLLGIDVVGSLLALASFVMLFLALEYNDQLYPWSSPRVIGLLCGFAVSLLLFIIWQFIRKEKALIVPSIIMRRTVAASCLLAFFIYGAMIIHGYYLPIWFQAIKGTSIQESGVDMLPFVVPNFVFSLLAGIIVTKTGYFTPPAIVGCAIATAATGLVSTLSPSSSRTEWVGYIMLSGAGIGIAIQQSFIAVQADLNMDQIPIATAAVTCFQSLGGAAFISIGNSILHNELVDSSNAHELPGIDIVSVIAAGATKFRTTIPAASLPAMVRVYNSALQKVFIAAIPLAGLAFASTLLLEWKSVKHPRGRSSTTSLISPEARSSPPISPRHSTSQPQGAAVGSVG